MTVSPSGGKFTAHVRSALRGTRLLGMQLRNSSSTHVSGFTLHLESLSSLLSPDVSGAAHPILSLTAPGSLGTPLTLSVPFQPVATGTLTIALVSSHTAQAVSATSFQAPIELLTRVRARGSPASALPAGEGPSQWRLRRAGPSAASHPHGEGENIPSQRFLCMCVRYGGPLDPG